MKKYFLLALIIGVFSSAASAQIVLPQESQRQSVTQSIGDTAVTIVYHRPNVKGREIFGGLEQYGKVWRAGANENTTFEISNDVTIDGKPLAKGKYGFHAIPNKDNWTLIFNKVSNEWGSYRYSEKDDVLRITVKPETVPSQETLSYNFENVMGGTGKVVLRWEKVAVPFTVDVGDFKPRTLAAMREYMKTRKPEDIRSLNVSVNYILNNKLKDGYGDAIGWLDGAIAAKETYPLLTAKARVQAEMGQKAQAIATGEKAVALGKATPNTDTSAFEKTLAEWKAAK